MEETKKRIGILKEEGFFDSWQKREVGLITFFIYPNLTLPAEQAEERFKIYEANAEKLEVKPPKTTFYIYPSVEEGQKLGLTPAITFVKEKEIHGNLNQSPGHELAHILLGELNPSENLPANGLWSEGVCVYLDGTKTNRKTHAISLNLGEEILKTSWTQWRKNIPGNLYPLAGSIVQYCDENFDWNRILDFLKNLKDSGANDEKLSPHIFNASYSKLQDDWREWLRN